MLDGMKKQIVRRILFPLQEKVKGHNTHYVLHELEQSQWLNTANFEARQQKRLNEFLSHAVKESAYYQNVFNSLGLTVNDIKSAKDIARLPFLDKAIIREHTEQIATRPLNELSVNRTGGSSGEPLVFYTSNERTSHDIAARMRANRWFGVDVGSKELVVWGAPHELNSQDRIKLLRDNLFRSKLISAFNMNDTDLKAKLVDIQNYQPEMIFAYPSAIYNIANYCQTHNIRLDVPHLKAIFVTSEMLFEDQRNVIERVFSAPVVNEYGGRDGGFIARECPEGNFHINADDIIVEIVDEAGNTVSEGESGEVVVTHLQSFGFPFIRYKMGDVASISHEKCACGRNLPVIKHLEGRLNDFLIGADNRKVHPNVANYIIRLNANITQYKVVQSANKQVEVFVVAKLKLDEAAKRKIISDFTDRLEDVGITITQVDNIAPEKSGKRRYIISNVE
ncbi:phenylacetate--CoA ligase family protein [Glaciecola sp. 2405UD65-10]|uniref:phenylacetate--CoA ligase family protein n=1 Tax=Glaciecola sp. 2405UD65-10 TaxID=3397244 RepID=UPI003B5C6AF5